MTRPLTIPAVAVKRTHACLLGFFLLSFGAPAPRCLAADPLTPLALTSFKATTNGLDLGWTDLGSAYTYTVQVRDTWGPGVWLSLGPPNQWPITTNGWTDLQPPASGTRFYRVVAQALSVQRGRLLSTDFIATLTKTDIATVAASYGLPIQAEQDVVVYKLTYETVDPFGGRALASGAFILPKSPSQALPLVSYQHGTLVKRTEAPSNMGEEALVGVAFATTGYAAAVPDYLGLGDSLSKHPYHHAKTEASAVVDMLRAARVFCATNGTPLNEQLFLCGYSQGGHATMAAAREIDTNGGNEFKLTASAPMAGAYDLSGVTANDFLSDRPMPNPYYFAYLLDSYQYVYHIAGSLAETLVAPYANLVPPLFDGQHSGGEINGVLPAVAHVILKPDYLLAFQNDPNHPLHAALRDNDLYDWKPVTPMHLYHCHGDRDVLYANSETALSHFMENGATQVQLIDPKPDADHSAGAIYCLQAAKAWFDGLKH